jgi:hypothetical protein
LEQGLNQEKTFWQQSHYMLHAPLGRRQFSVSNYLFIRKGLIHIFLCCIYADVLLEIGIIEPVNYFSL